MAYLGYLYGKTGRTKGAHALIDEFKRRYNEPRFQDVMRKVAL